MLLSYENEAIFAQQNGQDIDYVVPDETILIENPAAVTTNSKHPKAAKAFLDFVYTRRGAEDLRRQRLPPGRPRVPRPPARIPDPVGPVHHPGPRWLGRRGEEVLRHRQGHRHRRSSATSASRSRSSSSTVRHGAGADLLRRRAAPASLPGGPRRRRRRGPPAAAADHGRARAGDRARHRHAVPQRPRADPARPRWCGRRTDDGLGGFWHAITTPEARVDAEADDRRSLLVALVNVVMGTLIAWVLVRDGSPAARSSTR